MSDFDKEAEREKLREKYESDKEKRDTTEQMSELLLKGATMTNAHCSECGDPIFRYDGQEFCPTCEKAVNREETENTEGIDITEPSDETRVKFGADAANETENEANRDQTDIEQRAQQHAPGTGTQEQPTREESEQTGWAPGQSGPAGNQTDTHTNAGSGEPRDGIAAARNALVRTLVRFSQRAENCEDPRQAADELAPAREAAETLAALDR